MNENNLIRILVLLFALLLIIGGATYATQKVNAQNQYTSDLAERLSNRGVPVKNVVTLSQFPDEVEIALQSSSSNDQVSIEDNWFMQLARREATLAYRLGTGLKSFTLNVYNAKDEVIYSTQTFLYPDDLSQQLNSPSQNKVDNQTAKEIISDQLQLLDLSLDLLDIISENAEGFNGQVLLIQVSAKDLDHANKSLPTFLSSLFQMLDTINPKYGTYIVLCHLRLLDQTGVVLLDYVRDLESGTTQWYGVEGLYNEWYSQPVDANEVKPTSPPMLEAYPPPSTGPIQTQSAPAYPSP